MNITPGSGRSRGGTWGPDAPPLPYFWTKLRPEGTKKKFCETTPTFLSKGLDNRAPPYLRVWIRHCPATFIGNKRKLGHNDFLEVQFPAY